MCFIVQLPAISGNPFATSDNGYFVPRSPGTAPWNCIQARAAQLWFWLPPWSFIRPPFSLTTWPHGMFIWTFQSKGLRAPLSCTKLSCIWSTDCWIIGTALGANVKEPAKAKSAVPTGRKAGLRGFRCAWDGDMHVPLEAQGQSFCGWRWLSTSTLEPDTWCGGLGEVNCPPSLVVKL